ncbi:MAG TPA: hypothetical protein DCK78_14565 [Paenibacillus lactis]|nr:hypothetical protein [Paenibacillus lactis]
MEPKRLHVWWRSKSPKGTCAVEMEPAVAEQVPKRDLCRRNGAAMAEQVPKRDLCRSKMSCDGGASPQKGLVRSKRSLPMAEQVPKRDLCQARAAQQPHQRSRRNWTVEAKRAPLSPDSNNGNGMTGNLGIRGIGGTIRMRSAE